MLRITPFRNAVEAIKYFRHALATGDYFTQGVLRPSHWLGKTAGKLGLEGLVTDQAFERLAYNLHPFTGEQLTPRTRDERLVAYDFCFSVPKSVTALWAIGGDERIVEAVQNAVRATMRELELQTQTRVRSKGVNADRTTGNLVWSEYIHGTTRPVHGVPDPHLHVHCFAFNLTHDPEENRFKAAKFRPIKRDGPYYEAAFYSRLAKNLGELGYVTHRLAKGWEAEGVSAGAIRAFSRRTAEIEALAAELGITSVTQKAKLGARSREPKSDELSEPELLAKWRSVLTPEERTAIEATTAMARLRGPLPARGDAIDAEQALNHAIRDRFERASVVPQARLWEQALRHGLGDVTPEQVKEAAGRHRELVHGQFDDEPLVTTKAILAQEQRMIEVARGGRGQHAAMEGKVRWEPSSPMLNSQQQHAVRHVLESQDQLILIRGAAGTGKTTLMREAVSALTTRGKPVVVVAPTSDAARGVLRQSGFPDAETLQHLFTKPELQAKAKGGVIWADEAGLIGTPDMVKLLELARGLNARVVLAGDTRQHSPVQRGDALRLIEHYAGIKPAEVLSIIRQRGTYREAVGALSKGDYAKGVELLDKLGAIHEVSGTERLAAIAQAYDASRKAGESCLVVTPTHAEGALVTSLIRGTLKGDGRLAQADASVLHYRDTGWSEAQRADPVNYQPGYVLRFHERVGALRPGDAARVTHQDGQGRWQVEVMPTAGASKAQARRELPPTQPLPLHRARAFGVFEESTIPVAVGESLCITRNGLTLDRRHRVNNGAMYRLAGFTPQGHLRLENGWVLPRDFGHVQHGYVSTSHASQGKSVDRVIVSQGLASLGAASAQQFYVSVSRGKSGVQVFTDDRAAMIDAIRRDGTRRSAIELTDRKARPTLLERLREHALNLTRLRLYERARSAASRAREGLRPTRGRVPGSYSRVQSSRRAEVDRGR